MLCNNVDARDAYISSLGVLWCRCEGYGYGFQAF